MKINFHKFIAEQPSTMTLEEFADKYNCTLEIYECIVPNSIDKYYVACLDRIQHLDGSIPIDYYAASFDQKSSVERLTELISGKELIFNQGNIDKPERVKVPNLTFSGVLLI